VAGGLLTVTAPDGVRLAVREVGVADGPPIVFLHGFSQCHLAWRRQFADLSLGGFRLLACDLRGHGASDKPLDADRYRDDRTWADDVAAVLDQAGVGRAVFVAWSYAGRTLSDYVRHHGQSRIAAVNYVAAVTRSEKAFWGPALALTREMASPDLETNIRASRTFVQACLGRDADRDEVETTLAYVMLVPAPVRAAVLARTHNEGDMLPLLSVPVLVTHGGEDSVILPAAARYTTDAVPGARLSLYEGIGHSPFFEDPARFNRELIALADVAGL
jgi:pimeloyl-ACP methyl ester carboxylesterase